MNDLVMSREELAILANDFHSGDGARLDVTYPMYGERLFVLDTKKPELTDVIGKTEFYRCSEGMKPNSVDSRHMLGFDDFRNCMISSNVIGFRNEQDIIGWLRELKSQSKDPSIRSKPVLVGIDTNILYYGFISRHLSFQGPDRQAFHSGFRYVISDIVREEVDNCVEYKHSKEDIDAFKTTLRRGDLLNEFRHRCDLKARKAMLAFNECQFLRRELKAVGTSGKGTNNNEQNDREIARSYVRHARDNYCDIFLLTADEKMVTHASTCDIATKQLLLPTELPERCVINPWSVRNLFYDLAVTMGAISVGDYDGAMLLGEWRGKTHEDYTAESVNVRIADPGRYERVKSELETCRMMNHICGQGNGPVAANTEDRQRALNG